MSADFTFAPCNNCGSQMSVKTIDGSLHVWCPENCQGNPGQKYRIDEVVNNFIKKWCGDNAPHLLDTDENDGENFRQTILAYLQSAREEGRPDVQMLNDNIVWAERYAISRSTYASDSVADDILKLHKQRILYPKTISALVNDISKALQENSIPSADHRKKWHEVLNQLSTLVYVEGKGIAV